MTAARSPIPPGRTPPHDPPPASAVAAGAGGVGLVVAGALQLAAGLALVMTPMAGADRSWEQLVCWIAGGAALLISSIVLGAGRPGEPGIVGPSALGRVALTVFGADGLLGLGIGAVALANGADHLTAMAIGFTTVRLLGATTVTEVVLLRERRVAGLARWVLLLVVLCDIVSVLLLLALPGSAAFPVSGYAVRPALLVLMGVALLGHAGAATSRGRSRG